MPYTYIIKNIEDRKIAYSKIQDKLKHIVIHRDENDIVWESTEHEHIRDIERSYTSSRMDGGQACGEDDSGNSATAIYGSSYY